MRRKGKERVGCGRLPPLLSCEEAPSINSGSFHTARSRHRFTQDFACSCFQSHNRGWLFPIGWKVQGMVVS